MTDDTARALQEAEAAEQQAAAKADAEKRACLDQVARELPAKLDALAKKVAHEEPEVTKTLGPEGIKRLRSTLAEAASALGADLLEAADRIDWPSSTSDYSPVAANKVHTALFNYLYGQRVDHLASIIADSGYHTRQAGWERTQSLILPQSLYVEAQLAPLAEALQELSVAKRKTKKARKDDDEAIVDDIWDS